MVILRLCLKNRRVLSATLPTLVTRAAVLSTRCGAGASICGVCSNLVGACRYLRWYEMRGSMIGYMRSMISSANATAMMTVSATPWIIK